MKGQMLLGAIAALGAVAASVHAGGGANFIFTNVPYLNQDDSPFDVDSPDFWLEDFEDGSFDLPGASLSDGSIISIETNAVDSVDGDDGLIDGWGTGGRSLFVQPGQPGLSIEFGGGIGDSFLLPTHAGLVWTDGNADADVIFEAWDGDGVSLGQIILNLGDGDFHGQANEDRFIGVEYLGGISRIHISTSFNAFEVDHIQYGIIPAPGALALLGLAGLVIRRRRT